MPWPPNPKNIPTPLINALFGKMLSRKADQLTLGVTNTSCTVVLACLANENYFGFWFYIYIVVKHHLIKSSSIPLWFIAI